jgi:murein DD-endopeptidase MepM/ murein hydrolase activator NlpD
MLARPFVFALALAALIGCAAPQAPPASPPPSTAAALAAPPVPPTLPSPAPSATPTASFTATPAPSATLSSTPSLTPQPPVARFSYPIGVAGQALGDGFYARHGALAENTWYNPGYWHTGEDWYAVEGDTAGAQVYAVAEGEVVYVGSNYPGRVVIVRHADDLYSMYGHLDPAVQVQVGERLGRGALLGTVLRRGDSVPNHLHFEIRTFLTAEAVNGDAPRYGFRCGVRCPPGPGYWPIEAPDLPSEQGWRIPAHVIAQRMYPPDAPSPLGEVVVASQLIAPAAEIWSGPPDDATRSLLGVLALEPGARYPLLQIHAGPEASRATSALAYQLWYAIGLPEGRSGWVQAALPSAAETGGDGRPSSVYFHFFPAMGP